MVNPQIKITLAKAPITSALEYPKDKVLLAYLLASHNENIEMKNPETSENKWAASVIIAKDYAIYPPTNSMAINKTHTILANINFLISLSL